MRFIHIADIHASRERLSQTLLILNTLTERCKEGDIDCIIFAGDFWDSTITATKGSGFSAIVSAIRELEKYVYRIFFIYGTPTHEPNGSLDAFKSEVVQVANSMQYCGCDKFGIIAIPEPRRSEYIGKSVKEINDAINEKIKHFIFNQSDRKQTSHKDIPLIVVYHGEVKGAMYQNGIPASSPTAIPKKLLQSLKADYYALGHIHMPQEIFPNAWYSGSACPKNFGETHIGCYNLVEIVNSETKVKRVSFGLPQYATVNFDPRTVRSGNYENYYVRVQFDCTKEERKSLNIKQLADELREKINAISVKLEPNIIEGETVVKSEVVKHKSIVEKMTEYAKEKELIMPKYAVELLQDIQDNTLIKLAYPQHSFELLSLSLRGAVGIRDGQHKELFELNFETMEDGVVCLIGNCGRGKSTLIENCHPYPCMLTRDGALKDHFYLKDSHRILVYKDENDLYYRISMLIDGKTASGKVAYFVETSKDRKTWETLSDTDGSLDSYKKWVEQTFGSIDVFLRTAFFAKEQTKGTPDISATTKSERMELLSKLAGTDHLKEVSVIARELRKGIEDNANHIEIEIDAYSKYEEFIKSNKEDITNWKKELKTKESVRDELAATVSDLRVKDSEYQKNKALKEANKALYEQYKKEYDTSKERFDKLTDVTTNMEIYDEIDRKNQQINANANEIEKFTSQLNEAEKELSETIEEVALINKVITDYKIDLAKIESSEAVLRNQITDVNEVCPTCGSPLSEHKKEELLKHINNVQKELDKLLRDKETKEETLGRARLQLKEKDNSSKLKEDIQNFKNNIAYLRTDSECCTEYLDSVDPIYFELTYDDAVEEHMALSKKLEDLKIKMDAITDTGTLEDVSEKLSEAENNLRATQIVISDLTASINAAEKDNKRYEEELKTVKNKKTELKELKDKIIAYNFIEGAFSNNGIPAIELRESAPEIADIANKILADSYGNKFEIRFGNTSELKSNRKANEDFNIIVYDCENGDEKTIDLVSSGERIWLKQALFYAFSIVQMNRTGFNFRTRLIDESDGSLDGGLRPKYLKMVTAAHRIADSRVTMLITHSQEIKDIAQQIIEI